MSRKDLEIFIIDEGADLMVLIGQYNQLNQAKEEKEGELTMINVQISKLLKLLDKKGYRPAKK